MGSLLVGACGGEDRASDGPTATVPRATTTTDPYALPAVIDVAYVNRVLAGLDRAVGEVVRLVANSGSIPRDAIDRLRAIYVDQDQFQLELELLQSDLRKGLVGLRPNPGNRATNAVELLDVQANCVFARVDVDTSAVTEAPNPSFRTQWMAIVPNAPSPNSIVTNPTGWGVIYEGFEQNFTAPEDPCAGR